MAILQQFSFRSLIRGNIRILATRDALLAINAGLTGGLDTLYMKEVLGADAVLLGLFASIWSAVFLLFVLVGGWISDRYDRKKTLLIGTVLTLPNPLILALAPSWEWLILTNILGAIGLALATPAQVAILFTSVEQSYRSRALAVISTLSSLANTLTPPLGGLIVRQLGGLDDMRIIFAIQTILASAVWLYTAKNLHVKQAAGERKMKGLLEAVRDIFSQMRGVYRLSRERKATPWLYISFTGPLAWDIVGSLWTIYAAEVCRTPLYVVGLLVSVYGITHVLLQLPLANLADQKGRKKVILMTRPFLYLCLGTLLVGGTLRTWVWTPFLPILAWVMRSIGDSSGPSWTAISTEVIPAELQSQWEALKSFIWRITSIPASLLGGYLWNINPRFPFIISLVIDGLIRFPILIYKVPETLIAPHTQMPVPGPHVVIYGLSGAGLTSTAQLVRKELQAEIVTEGPPEEKPQESRLQVDLEIPSIYEGIEGKSSRIDVDRILDKKEPAIIEGKPAVFAAREAEKATIVLLVASKQERARREAKKKDTPEFVALREVEEEDRRIARLTRRLYGADITKLPPFDVAINTERVPSDKITRIISILHEDEKKTTSKT